MVSHASTNEWQSFEMRMRRRRAERVLLRAEVAAEAGCLDEARECLSEARALAPSMPALAETARKIEEYAERPMPVGPMATLGVIGPVFADAAVGMAAAPSASASPKASEPVTSDLVSSEPAVSEPAASDPVASDPVAAAFSRKIIRARKIVPIAAGLAIAVAVFAARVSRAPGTATAAEVPVAAANSVASTPPERGAPIDRSEPSVALERAALDRSSGPTAATPPDPARAALAHPEAAASAVARPVPTSGESTSDAVTRLKTDRVGFETPRPEPRFDLPRLAASAGASELPGVTTGALSIPAVAAVEPREMTLAPLSLPDPILPATTASAPIATAVDASSQDAAVRRVLNRYASAYSDLDADAAQRVWPGVNRAALSRAFEALAAQRVSLGDCKIQIAAANAQARCAGSATWSPKVGNGAARTEQRIWTFELARAGSGWQIVSARVQNR